MKVKKSKQEIELEQQIGEITQDLQRTRADFENYRKRMELEKSQMADFGKMQTILKLLPVVDNIERAITHLPEDLKNNPWAEGVVKMSKDLYKMLEGLNIKKIDIVEGKTEFNPEYHEAISMEGEDGQKEVISEELQKGYLLGDQVLRHAMVRVKRSN